MSDFFKKKNINQSKKIESNRVIDNPILYKNSENPEITFVLDILIGKNVLEKLRNQIINKVNPVLNYQILYAHLWEPKEKDLKSNLGDFYYENRIDYKKYIKPFSKVITLGRTIFQFTEGNSDLNVGSFYDFIFNKTYFYSPYVKSWVFPIDYLFSFLDKDNFESFFALRQIQECIDFNNIPMRIPKVEIVRIKDSNEFLLNNMEPKEVAWDIETSSLDWTKGKIGCITMSFDGRTGYYLDWEKIDKEILSRFFENKFQILNNGKFDCLYLRQNGIRNMKVDWDNLQAGHYLHTDRKNSLKVQSYYFTYFGGYEKELDLYKKKYPKLKNYLHIPKDILSKYATMDAIETFQVYQYLKKAISDNDQKYFCNEEWNTTKFLNKIVFPSINSFIEIEYEGCYITWDKVRELSGYLDKEINKIKSEIFKSFDIQEKDLDLESTEKLGVFLKKIGWERIELAKKGHFKTNNDCLSKWKKLGHKEAELILKYRELSTLQKTFVGYEYKNSGFFQYRKKDNKVHSNFLVMLADTGRSKCVAKGTKVLVSRDYIDNPNGIPIEDIEVGDSVYCFDNDKKLVLRKVLNKFNNGDAKVMRLKFKVKGNPKKINELYCTPEHKIRLYNGSYVQAKELITSNIKKYSTKNSKSTTYRTIPHRVMAVRQDIEGSRLFISHAKKENLLSIGLSETKNNLVLSHNKIYNLIKYYNIDYFYDKSKKEYKINFNNHYLVSAEYTDITMPVYDLEVEEYHNYIANEICVHNCKAPNLTNIPKHGYYAKKIREFFITPSEDFILNEADGKSLQLMIVGSLSKDEKMKYVFNEVPGSDMHSMTAQSIFKPDMSLDEFISNRETNKELDDYRFKSKACFVKGTELLTNQGWKKVEDFIPEVNKGKHIFYNGDLKMIGVNGEEKRIETTYYDEKNVFVGFGLENKDYIEVTYDHQMIVERYGHVIRVFADDVEETDKFLTSDLKGICIKDIKICIKSDKEPVYCLSVPKDHEVIIKGSKTENKYRIGQCNFSLVFNTTGKSFAQQSLEPEWSMKDAENYLTKNNLVQKPYLLYDKFLNDHKDLNLDFCKYWAVAIDIKKKFFETYPKVREWIDNTIQFARDKGYIASPFGAYRLLTKLLYIGKDSNYRDIKNLENISTNSPVQNFEVVLMMNTLNTTIKQIKEENLKTKIVNNVHDSLVSYIYKDEKEQIKKIMKDEFEKDIPEKWGIKYKLEGEYYYPLNKQNPTFWGFNGEKW